MFYDSALFCTSHSLFRLGCFATLVQGHKSKQGFRTSHHKDRKNHFNLLIYLPSLHFRERERGEKKSLCVPSVDKDAALHVLIFGVSIDPDRSCWKDASGERDGVKSHDGEKGGKT